MQRPGTSPATTTSGPTPSKNLFGSNFSKTVGGAANSSSAAAAAGGSGGGGGYGGNAAAGFYDDDNGGDGSRTPLTAAIDTAMANYKQSEANVAALNDGLQELQANAVRSKQLEAELGPRETETKNVINSFHRLVDVGTRIRKGRGKKDASGDDHAGGDHDEGTINDSESQMSRSEAAGGGLKPGGGAAAAGGGGSRRFGLNLLAGKEDLSKDEMADRDAVRHLANKIRHLLTPVFSEMFFLSATQREQQKAALLAQQQQAEADAAAAAAAASSGQTKPGRRQQQQGGGSQGGGKNSAAAGLMNPLTDRLDPELYLIPGIDPSFFTDLLNLRQARLTSERAMKKTQEQLAQAQSVVVKRRNDGSNKAALRKAEKVLAAAQASLRELHRQKEEREIRRRLEAAAAADANAAAQAAANAMAGTSGGKRGTSRPPPRRR